MSAAVIMTTTMIAPVPAYDAAVDRFIIAGRSLPADAFHDASAHGSAPASMFMLMLAASAADIGCACVRTHGHGHARIHAYAYAYGYRYGYVYAYACGDCRLHAIALLRACFASPAACRSSWRRHSPLRLPSFRTRSPWRSICVHEPFPHHGRGRLMGGVREPERRAEGIIRR